MMAIITLENISKQYKIKNRIVTALNNVNFEAEDGAFLVLTGSSGSGNRYRRKQIGIVFQRFYLEPTLTLRQNIELPAMFLKMPALERKQRTFNLASLMGLSGYLDHLPSELSGGQIQRIAVARALYNNPSILIADEPTSNLDHDNVRTVIAMFKRIQQAYGTTIIVAAHDMTIARTADQVIRLENGSIAS